MSSAGFLGAGDLYIARQVDGVFGDFEGPFSADKFEIKPSVDLKEQSSKGRSTYGQVTASVALAKPTELTVELTQVDKVTLAYALLGSTAVLTQASGSATAEAVTAKLDKWVDLAKRRIGATGFVLTNVGASITYVEGVDYKVNRNLGMLLCTEAGAIVADAPLLATYTYGASNGTRIKGVTNTQIVAKFRLDGINLSDSTPCVVNVHQGVIAASSAFDFLASNFAQVKLPGKMVTPSGKTEPFTVDLLEA